MSMIRNELSNTRFWRKFRKDVNSFNSFKILLEYRQIKVQRVLNNAARPVCCAWNTLQREIREIPYSHT